MTNSTSPARPARTKARAASSAQKSTTKPVPLLPDWWEPEWTPFDVLHNKGKDVLADIHATDPKGFELYVDELTAEIYGHERLNQLLALEITERRDSQALEQAGFNADTESLEVELELEDLPGPRHALADEAPDPEDTDPDEADIPADDPAYADAAEAPGEKTIDFKPTPYPREPTDGPTSVPYYAKLAESAILREKAEQPPA